MMGTMRLFLWVFMTLTLMLEETDATPPAFKVPHDKLVDGLKNMTIPSQSGRHGHLEYFLWNIQILDATVPGSNVVQRPASRQLTWYMSNLGVKLHTDWRVKYKRGWLLRFSTHGSVDVDIKAVSLTVSITLGADDKERLTVSVTKCDANVGDVGLKFHGGTGWILNMFKGRLGRKVRDMMKGQICNVVQKVVNDRQARKKNEDVTYNPPPYRFPVKPRGIRDEIP